jgi:hypothetical protein
MVIRRERLARWPAAGATGYPRHHPEVPARAARVHDDNARATATSGLRNRMIVRTAVCYSYVLVSRYHWLILLQTGFCISLIISDNINYRNAAALLCAPHSPAA